MHLSRFITESPDAPIPEYTSCSFEIYATNQLYKGRYIVASAHISVGVTDSASQVHSSFEVYKSNYDVEESSIYNVRNLSFCQKESSGLDR